MDARSRESFLIHVMNNGFHRAATSFSKLIQKKVKIVNAPYVLIRHEDEFSFMSEEEGDLDILITQIIGEISGRSYLILNHEESQEVFKSLKTNSKNDALNEAFLKEIDNIISASVISELSNHLKMEIYGDVPQLVKVKAVDLRQFMNNEMNPHEPTSMVFCNTTFLFEGGDQIHPQFIWKLSTKVFERVPVEKIIASGL